MQTKQQVLGNERTSHPVSSDQKSVRLSGNISGTQGVKQKSATWESAHQAQHGSSMRSNGSRSNIFQQSGHNQSSALHRFEQKILQTKQKMSAEQPLMVGSPQKTGNGASNNGLGGNSHQR